MDTCSVAASARVTPSSRREKIKVEGIHGGACFIMPSGYVSLMGFKRMRDLNACFQQALKLASLRPRDISSPLQITNMTYKLTEPMPGPLNLEHIAQSIPHAVYNPSHFPAVIIKNAAACTCLIYANGQVLVTGVRSKVEGRRELESVVAIAQETM